MPSSGPICRRTSRTIRDLTLVRMGTLSKTLGALGGFLAGPQDVIDLMVNLARPYIFTTGLTPGDAAAALAALGVLRSPEGDALVARLADLVARVDVPRRRGDDEVAMPEPRTPTSPIIPVILGSEERAVKASAALLAQGLWVPAIRPPTVPVGTSRLRVTLSAAHTDEQVDAVDRGAGPPAGRPPGPGPLTHVPPRPQRLVVVVGTGTDIGKTWVSARLLTALRAGGSDRGRPQTRPILRRGGRSGRPRLRGARRGHRRAFGNGVPPAPVVPGGDGPADGGRCPRTGSHHDGRLHRRS